MTRLITLLLFHLRCGLGPAGLAAFGILASRAVIALHPRWRESGGDVASLISLSLLLIVAVALPIAIAARSRRDRELCLPISPAAVLFSRVVAGLLLLVALTILAAVFSSARTDEFLPTFAASGAAIAALLMVLSAATWWFESALGAIALTLGWTIFSLGPVLLFLRGPGQVVTRALYAYGFLFSVTGLSMTVALTMGAARVIATRQRRLALHGAVAAALLLPAFATWVNIRWIHFLGPTRTWANQSWRSGPVPEFQFVTRSRLFPHLFIVERVDYRGGQTTRVGVVQDHELGFIEPLGGKLALVRDSDYFGDQNERVSAILDGKKTPSVTFDNVTFDNAGEVFDGPLSEGGLRIWEFLPKPSPRIRIIDCSKALQESYVEVDITNASELSLIVSRLAPIAYLWDIPGKARHLFFLEGTPGEFRSRRLSTVDYPAKNPRRRSYHVTPTTYALLDSEEDTYTVHGFDGRALFTLPSEPEWWRYSIEGQKVAVFWRGEGRGVTVFDLTPSGLVEASRFDGLALTGSARFYDHGVVFVPGRGVLSLFEPESVLVHLEEVEPSVLDGARLWFDRTTGTGVLWVPGNGLFPFERGRSSDSPEPDVPPGGTDQEGARVNTSFWFDASERLVVVAREDYRGWIQIASYRLGSGEWIVHERSEGEIEWTWQ